jgi:outer membrane receptor protein involved in Fe transport
MKASMRLIVAALLTVAMALCAFAQSSTTGSIEGSVADTNGAPVPNVTVTVSSSNLIRPQTAQTNGEGRYQILNLPPGRYTVKVAATSGFADFSRSDVEVNLSKTSSADITLQPAGATAEVNVTATSGAGVDVTNNTSGTNVSADQFSNFPTQRTVQSLYSIAPTVVRSGLRDASGRDIDPSVAGSSGPENNYILDGVNTSDPAYGGSGANLPFEFVQEVEVKTGAYGAEYGKSTGGIFNVITKSGGNEFHGDLFGNFTTKGLVRDTKSLPFTGSAPNGFSEQDLGVDVGGPIKKDKVWFFAAFNPQVRKNYFLTQKFLSPVNNKITTPFYSGKITYSVNQNNTLTFSTFGDRTTQKGFLFGGSGFGADPSSFRGNFETGGENYTGRLNSTITPNWIGEFSFGLHFQRANIIPEQGTSIPLVTDNFAIVKNGAVLPVVQTSIAGPSSTGNIDFIDGRGGSLERNFIRQGFGLYQDQDRNRWEFSARLQNLVGPHTIKYGFEYTRNIYKINLLSTGPNVTFADPNGLLGSDNAGLNQVNGYRVTNNFGVCAVQGSNLVCPTSQLVTRATQLINGGGAPAGITGATLNSSLTAAQLQAAPFLIRVTTRVRDFENIAPDTHTNVESFYLQDDYKVTKDFQFNFGLRWDYQQAYGRDDFAYLKLNSFMHNMQPRVGLIWDFTGNGRGKVFANYARFLETPIPLDLNVRAGSDTSQIDKNFNVDKLNAASGSIVAGVIGNLGAAHTPIDPDLRPQTVNELTGGISYEIVKDLALEARYIYRAQGSVIEDGSFDNGNTYFLFNPGERRPGSTELKACEDPNVGCFGRARRYYRALEISATKRFAKNYQFIASYVYSSLIGNYEGLFRNDNGQSDPNITSLFDLVSLLKNTYGRLPNDRPHVFKFDGSYKTPIKLMVGGSFRAQSGIPFNALIPDPSGAYGNNEGFAVPRGTAINPLTGKNRTPFTTNLDLNAYYPIHLSENKQLRLQVDWFNVFNTQRAIRQDETFTINSGIPNAGAGANSIQFANPFYGAGTIFQFPSYLRLGVKFQF